MHYRWLLSLVLLLLVLPAPARGQNEIRLHWQRYDTVVTINPDGTMRVQEQQVLVVEQGPLRRMTREFVTGDKGQVRNIRVLEDGQPYQPGTDSPGTYAGSDTGAQARIQLWFRDPNAAQHSFTIEYTVARALVAQGDQAQLDWSFFWSSPNAPPIRAGSVEIRLPQQANPDELRLDASGAPVELVSEANPIRWELTSEIQGVELNVLATFPRTALASNANFRSSQTNTQPRANVPAQPAPVPGQVPGAAPAGGVNIIFCVIVLIFLFIAFSIIRSSARARTRRGYPPVYGPGPNYGPDPFFGPQPRSSRRRRRQRGLGGWGGGFFPPIIINPPYQPRDQGGPFNAPLDGSGGGGSSWGDSGGSGSSWGDSGGGGSSWGDSGGGGSSWGNMGGGSSGGGGRRGGGGSNDNGGSGGGSFG